MARTQGPCIGTCKFRRPGPAGTHCIGCSMTETQKKIGKSLEKPKAVDAFLSLVLSQQARMGGYRHWRSAYLGRCVKKATKPSRLVTGDRDDAHVSSFSPSVDPDTRQIHSE